MSENALRVAPRLKGYSNDDMTTLGFRAMAGTIMVERLNMHLGVIEAQLAHGKSGPLVSACDRTEFMGQRGKMMNGWANCLERLSTGVNVLPNECRQEALQRTSSQSPSCCDEIAIAVPGCRLPVR